MPLEALRYPMTPAGLHYLLIHYDIPAVDEATYRLEVDGLVATPLSLSLEDLRAGRRWSWRSRWNGGQRARAHRATRLNQPWLQEAVGTARWRGTPLRRCWPKPG